MESMTGFGSGSASGELGSMTVQLSSVNNRGCRVNVRSEIRDLALEERLRAMVQEEWNGTSSRSWKPTR